MMPISFSMLRVLVFGLLLSFPAKTLAAFPGDVCSFYQSIWQPQFKRCSEPKVKHAGCVIKGFPFPRKGDLVSLYLPDFLIETGTGFGSSLFEGLSPQMKKHMDLAKKWQSKHTSSFGLASMLNDGGLREKEQTYFWYGRLLPVPAGGLNHYPSVRAGAGGSALPICFSGIAEFYPDQWLVGLADLPFATSWMPLGLLMCQSPAGAVGAAAMAAAANEAKQKASSLMSSLTGVDSSGFASGSKCAYPISAKVGLGKNLEPNSDALNASKLCMGTLGNLLPREGTIDSQDRFRSSVIAAWRFASLVHDFHGESDAGIDSDDKWQIMYPENSDPGCFRAGQLADSPPGPFEKRSLSPERKKDETYVYAIWRKRTACLELSSGKVWQGEVAMQQRAMETMCGGRP